MYVIFYELFSVMLDIIANDFYLFHIEILETKFLQLSTDLYASPVLNNKIISLPPYIIFIYFTSAVYIRNVYINNTVTISLTLEKPFILLFPLAL